MVSAIPFVTDIPYLIQNQKVQGIITDFLGVAHVKFTLNYTTSLFLQEIENYAHAVRLLLDLNQNGSQNN